MRYEIENRLRAVYAHLKRQKSGKSGTGEKKRNGTGTKLSNLNF